MEKRKRIKLDKRLEPREIDEIIEKSLREYME